MSVSDIGRPASGSIRCAVLTVSDTRTPDTDTSGRAIQHLFGNAGHHIVDYQVVPDDPSLVTPIVRGWAQAADIRIIVTTGGTGIAARDSTYEAVTTLFEKELRGFGEIFRMLSYQEIGAAAMLSRATAGVLARSAMFVLPGSEPAVRLAMTRLILPELEHVVRELEKDRPDRDAGGRSRNTREA
jgi:molybdenum cofactor biosynthesis protein B